MTDTNSLLQFMNCERLDDNFFRGQSKDFKTGQVYGGQVLGQAIKAAQSTVDDDRSIHSAHAYFLRRGDVNAPILYTVDRSRDGGSFSSRRVVAIQHGHQIFHLSASFQVNQPGLEFYNQGFPPTDLLDGVIDGSRVAENQFQSQFLDAYILNEEEKTAPDSFQMWVRTKHPLPEGQDAHCSVLAYISDMGLLLSAFVPHARQPWQIGSALPNMVVASLDHAIWFHRPFRADDWFFYDCRAESTSNSRGFSHGRVFTRDGALVASTSQEGLLRQKEVP
ncbi:MAG: acyl-CoA thioesterase II [Porticoccaceae bacterium]|nr:acyl-CoA thioesterase II [Porticoccaceae bacterium]